MTVSVGFSLIRDEPNALVRWFFNKEDRPNGDLSELTSQVAYDYGKRGRATTYVSSCIKVYELFLDVKYDDQLTVHSWQELERYFTTTSSDGISFPPELASRLVTQFLTRHTPYLNQPCPSHPEFSIKQANVFGWISTSFSLRTLCRLGLVSRGADAMNDKILDEKPSVAYLFQMTRGLIPKEDKGPLAEGYFVPTLIEAVVGVYTDFIVSQGTTAFRSMVTKCRDHPDWVVGGVSRWGVQVLQLGEDRADGTAVACYFPLNSSENVSKT